MNQLLSGVQAATEDADPERFMSIHQEAMPAKMAWPELVSEALGQGEAAPGLLRLRGGGSGSCRPVALSASGS
jgi:hypothetical protein